MFLNIYSKPAPNTNKKNKAMELKDNNQYKSQIVWFNVIVLTVLHVIATYGLYILLIQWKCQLVTFIFHFLWSIGASFGITGGAHRLWCHRSYKANNKLKILFCIFMSMIFANDIYTWVRDHRAHHKFSETNADPHNAKRGLFFSHCGWLLVKRHPDVLSKGGTISYKDLEDDPVVMFHKKYYAYLMPLGTFVLPSLIPWYFWNQDFSFVLCITRYMINIHIVWSLNSFAHLYGSKPYDSRIYASENSAIMYITIGEGFHNYHHVFPWDYKAAEFGDDKRNLTTFLINWFAKIGWATELKIAPKSMIKARASRTGDGSWSDKNCADQGGISVRQELIAENSCIWGWEDPDLSKEVKKNVLDTYK